MVSLPFLLKPHSLGTIASGNERAEKPAVHLGVLDAIGMTWRSNGASNLWIRGDFGSARPIDFVSLVHANAQAGTTIRVRLGDTQAEVDGTADYNSGVLPFIAPSIDREDGLYSSHLELLSLQTKRWWRIDIAGHTGDFEAAKLVLGKRIIPSRYYSSGFEFGDQDMGTLELTKWGIPDRQDGLILSTLKFKLGWIDEAEYEGKIRPLMRSVARREVLMACFDPTPNAYRQSRTFLGWLKDDPFAVGGGLKPGTFAQDFSILSMIGPDSGTVASPVLGGLVLDDVSIPEDAAATINILGTTTGSTLSISGGSLPAGMTLNSGARTITGTPTTPGVSTFGLAETLAGATNSPNTTAGIEITVTATFVSFRFDSSLITFDTTSHTFDEDA
jgi:hypothetical protein